MQKIIFALLLSALAVTNAHAELYKRVDEQGNVTYGDQPGGQAKPVQPGGLTTYSPPTRHTEPPAAQSKETSKKDPAQAATHYSELLVLSPAKDEAIQSNDGNVSVKARATPPLDTNAGHQLVVLLDQKPGAKAPAAEALLKNVDRGTHTLRAQITDANGTVLAQSPEVTFHIRRGSQIKR